MKSPDFTIKRMENPERREAEAALHHLGANLARIITDYFTNEENRHEYEQWYLETHGTPYVWKTRRV